MQARDDEREARDYVTALNEHAEEQFNRGIESAHGYDEDSFIAGVRWALDRGHPEPEITGEPSYAFERNSVDMFARLVYRLRSIGGE